MHLIWCDLKLHSSLRAAFFCAVALMALLRPDVTLASNSGVRTLSIYNIHTKQTVTVTFKRNGKYIPEGLEQLSKAMGDWRRGEHTKMDPELIDLLWEIHTELGSKKPIYLISGYRSLKTNNLLRKTVGGQAKQSRHILGKAADVHFPDVSIRDLRNSALIRQRGGVGYYPTSAIPFVHLDTDRVRHWPRMGRYELAALFPNGRSQHVPSDGKPITKQDHAYAIARLNEQQKEAVRLAAARVQKAPEGPQIASLAEPPSLNGVGKSVNGLLSAWNSRKQETGKEEGKFDRKGLLRLASLTPEKDLSPDNQDKMNDSGGSPLSNGWVSAPEYDDDHADELSYSPFPILPLMRDKSVSYDTDLASLQAPEHDKVLYLFGEPTQMIPLGFRQGLQFSEMLWASDFQGKAIMNIMTGQPQYPDHHLKALRDKKGAGRSIFARN